MTWLFRLLARHDFNAGIRARFVNSSYLDEYGRLYAQGEIDRWKIEKMEKTK